jgi:hypothetical protein
MYFNEGDFYRQQSIAQGDTGVSKGTGVYDEEAGTETFCCMDSINQRTL